MHRLRTASQHMLQQNPGWQCWNNEIDHVEQVPAKLKEGLSMANFMPKSHDSNTPQYPFLEGTIRSQTRGIILVALTLITFAAGF